MAEFQMEIVASDEEMDELGHVSNIAYVRWIQEVAKSHSRAVGWDYDAYLTLGAVFVVRRHEVDYLAPAYAGERLCLTTWVTEWAAASSVRKTRIARVSDAREVATASTLWALVSTSSGRPRRIPPEIKDAFS